MAVFNINIPGLIRNYQQQQAEEAGREKIKGLIGGMRAETGQQQILPQEAIDPATGEAYTYEKSILPTTVTGSEALMESPSNLARLYGDMVTTPGFEEAGQQGLLGIQRGQQAQLLASAGQGDKKSQEAFEQETKLRKEFGGETKGFIDINDAYGRIKASAVDPSPAGDLALIFNYMKMLDPGSTVREGEFATAQSSGSVPTRIASLYNQILEGTRLTPQQRSDFMGRAGGLYNTALESFGKRKGTYEKLAKQYALDPSRVTFGRQMHEQYTPEQQAGLIQTQPQRLGGTVPPPPGFVRD